MIRLVLILALLVVLTGAAFLLLSAPRTAGAPEEASATGAAPEMAAPAAPGNSADAAANSFIVCPGDPRCP